MHRRDLETAIENMKSGDSVIYHVGNLMYDRNFGTDFMRVDNTADTAWQAMEAGKVSLVQERHPGSETPRYSYIAIKRSSPYERVYWSGCYDPKHALNIRLDAACRT